MNVQLKVAGFTGEFKVDTGFDGTLLVDSRLFDGIPGGVQGSAVFRTAAGPVNGFAKLAVVEFGSKKLEVVAYHVLGFDVNLVGEPLIRRLGVLLDYKEGRVVDP